MITFKPKQVTKKLLSVLPPRARDVLERRYGLGADGEQHTLENIGQSYGITRERVRQIENHAIAAIQRSSAYTDHEAVVTELQEIIERLGGGVIAEHVLLEEITDDPILRNHVFFLLVCGHPFVRSKENKGYAHRWYTKKEIATGVENALKQIYSTIQKDELLPEEEIITRFREHLAEVAPSDDSQTLMRWLKMSKQLASNPLGEWGDSTSPNVRIKGIRDYAYLVVKRHGSPMHFREVSAAIEELFGKKAHTATTHNELIKDDRFVLVGRGLYALTEWGYSAGVVKDVLREVLNEYGPLTREEIIDKVRKERYVKDNTIVVNLQDTNIFKRLPNGAYTVLD